MPIDETFTFFLGAGAGYHPFTSKTRLVYDLGGGEVESLIEYRGHGIVPHMGFGLEAALSKRISVFGQVRQLIGSYRSERTDEATGIEYKFRYNSPGIEVLAGLRIHI
jgi:hypothetical protein